MASVLQPHLSEEPEVQSEDLPGPEASGESGTVRLLQESQQARAEAWAVDAGVGEALVSYSCCNKLP